MIDPDGGTVEPPRVVPTRPTSTANERPPGHYDIGSGYVTMPDGTEVDEEELRRRMRPPGDPQ